MEVYIIFQLFFFSPITLVLKGSQERTGRGEVWKEEGYLRGRWKRPMYSTLALVKALRGVGSWGRCFRIRRGRSPPNGSNEVKKKNHTKPRTGFDQKEIFLRAPSNSCDKVYMSRRWRRKSLSFLCELFHKAGVVTQPGLTSRRPGRMT